MQFSFLFDLESFEIQWGKNNYLISYFLLLFQSGKKAFKSEKFKQPPRSLVFPVFLDCSSDDSQIRHEKGVENGNRSYPALPSNTRSFTCAPREALGNLAEEINTSGVFWLSCKI